MEDKDAKKADTKATDTAKDGGDATSTDKSAEVAPKTRVKRPDTAAEEGDADAGADKGDTAKQEDAKKDSSPIRGPFTAEGATILDADGKQVAFIGFSQSTAAARAKIAKELVEKLNA